MLETINEYKAINEKMGETVCLAVEKLGVSEYNTRSTCVDEKHVDALAKKIMERGFHPKRAISVNVIRGTGGGEVSYRVAAGIHRLEATKKAGLGEIPCLLYYDLTEEEECLLDRWDNEMDEDHKEISFLEEAEHDKYLTEVKKWSQRQIVKTKGGSRGDVIRKLKIASIPEGAKRIIRGGSDLIHFVENHFQEICKLKQEPHIIAICEEIAERGRLAARGEVDQFKKPIHPMRQSDIEKRVKELLEVEKKGKIEKRVKEPAPKQLELFSCEEKVTPEEEEHCITRTVVEDAREMPVSESPPEKSPPEPIPELSIEMSYKSPEKNSRKMNLDRCVRWLKLAGLIREMGQTAYIVLRKIEEYDLWYRANQDEPFFFGEEVGGDPYAFIAEESGVEREHLQKRAMPFLKKEGFVNYWMDKGVWWFKLNWEKLFEVYRRRAYSIPFKEDGLKGIPETFSGVIRPTPFHYIKVEKGKVAPWDGGKVEVSAQGDTGERTAEDALREELRTLNPPMAEKEIAFCLSKRSETEIALKLLSEMDPKKREKIRNKAGYIIEMVKSGPKTPDGFVTPEEAKKGEQKDKKLRAFLEEFKGKRLRYFCPGHNRKYEIVTVSEDSGFFYKKDDGSESFSSFEKCADLKYFQ